METPLNKGQSTGSGTPDGAASPRVTVVVTPRERFGVARQSLESIYATADTPFRLVYVDARSPRALSGWLTEEAARRGFDHVRLDWYASPNEARNIGVARADTPYVVFIDNDVICSEGWLSALVACAEETGAAVVAPLTCHGLPLHTSIHQAGGAFAEDPATFFAAPFGEREVIDEMHLQGVPVKDARAQLRRTETQTCEFHCVLVRRDVFARVGPLDEEMLATKEHLDFCMTVSQAGGKVLLEPASVVTYLFPNRHNPITREDWPFFLVRWSKAWQASSLERLRRKWGLREDGYLAGRRGNLGWRHFEGIVKPVLRRAPLVGGHRLWLGLGRRAAAPVCDLASRVLIAARRRPHHRHPVS